MKTKAIPSFWLHIDGRRFDSGPYTSGSLEAKIRLEEMRVPKDRLADLTFGHDGGIYNGPQFSRNWVDSEDHGVPFLGSSSMLLADLSHLPLLRSRDAESPKLAYLRIQAGTTLISCSGTIGRMVYTRPEMDGMWTSQDIMKIVPNPGLVPPGYVYAFLSGKFGVPMVSSGTYGAIIQHIEPQHLADLPVPRLGKIVEQQIHDLVVQAASARSQTVALRLEAVSAFNRHMKFQDRSDWRTSISFNTFAVRASNLSRLDAAHYAPSCIDAQRELAGVGTPTTRLGLVARIFTPGIFKRRHVDDAESGYAYYSGTELFQLAPTRRGYLSRKSPNIGDYLVEKDWLLIQDAGQLGGLIGRLTRVGPTVAGGVVSNHLMRVVPDNRVDGAYLFTALTSPHGYRAITRHAFGTSIPQLDPKHIADLVIPWPEEAARRAIAAPMARSWELGHSADEAEALAVSLVERAIGEAC